jgi:hypothetical protein
MWFVLNLLTAITTAAKWPKTTTLAAFHQKPARASVNAWSL